MRRRTPFVYLALFAVALGAFFAIDRYAPPQHLPWRSLDMDAPLGLATDTQLMRLALSPSSVCRKMVVDSERLQSVNADPHRPQDPCGWDTARIVYGGDTFTYSPGETTMQCPLAVGSFIWVNELDRLARARFGQPLSKVHHAGSYSCRRQVGNGSGRWSEHAFANAWDVTGFSLADGTLISVLNDWNGETEKKEFLRDARDTACRIFRVTLSPDYNSAHHDHFHLDMGPYASCR